MSEPAQIPDAEAVRAKLAELKIGLDTSSLPYQLEKMFPRLKGWGVKKEIKTKVKLIQQVEAQLPEMLFPNEQILYIAKGVQHSLIEALTIGALWSSMINQTVFVLTNLRLLMIRSNSKGKPAETCWMIYYSEIKKFKPTLTGVLDVRLVDGKSIRFTGFSKLDKKSMPRIFEEARETYRERGFEPKCSQSREDLCGRCFTIVPKASFQCGKCQTRFWTPGEVALRSLVFPAWGDFLLKHRALACVEILGIVFTWFIAVSLASDGHYLDAAILIGIAHSFDAVVTYFIAKKGLHPAGKAAQLEPAT
jgi:hypothetical protein